MNDIAVIVPTYNVEDYIEKAMLSIINQNFSGKIELIIIDDCSTDLTVEKVNNVIKMNKNFNIKFLQQKQNMRQGTARNRGIKECNSKYIIFLDGDDFFDNNALQTMFEKAEKENCDFVVCDWAYYYEDKGVVYVNNERFMNNNLLEEAECEDLLAAGSYFTVNKLYRKNFLVQNNIYYGEGYIYEDFEFYIDVAQKAKKIGIVQNPFYKVRINNKSTTKTNTKSREHIDSVIKAIDATLKKFQPRKEISRYFLYRYLLTRTLNYTKYRAPRKYQKSTIKTVIDNMNEKELFIPKNLSPFYDVIFGRGLVQNSKYNRVIFFYNLYSNRYLKRAFFCIYKEKLRFWKFRQKIKKKYKNFILKLQRKYYHKAEIEKNLILFLGFDYKYLGNSKYLFNYIIENYSNEFEVFFVTNNENVNKKYRVKPRSKEFYHKLGKAKIVIAESWIPLDFPKKENQKWIQLWHGTPFKKLLFDSHEQHIMKRNPNHKRNKSKDIARWDILLSDSEVANEKFESSFDYDKKNILSTGYPRVQWLKENQDNFELKNQIKDMLDIDKEKKVVLYAPTWRDYNFKESVLDLDYVLNLSELQNLLGEEYVVVNKNHALANNISNSADIITPHDDIETQSLLLIADTVISDYSSIIFDAIAVNKKFNLYINDFAKYEDARGVYSDMLEDLSPYITDDIIELVEMIKKPTKQEQDLKLQTKYSSMYQKDSNLEIYKKITEMM